MNDNMLFDSEYLVPKTAFELDSTKKIAKLLTN